MLWDEYVMYLLKPIVNTLPGKWAFRVIYNIIFIPAVLQKLKLKYDCHMAKLVKSNFVPKSPHLSGQFEQ